MRDLLVPAFLLVALLAPTVPADTRQGQAYGVDAFYVSAGGWDAWEFTKTGGTSMATIRVTWVQAAVLGRGVDYDLTLWRPGSIDDGALTPDEVIGRSWTYGWQTTEERIEMVLSPGTYVITVEPIEAHGERFTLSADPGTLVHSNPPVPGVKLG